jgi:ribosomal 50S subunit-recycling heat shock protein
MLSIQLNMVEGAWRLDKVLSEHITDVSRARIRGMIKAGWIRFNQKKIKPGAALKREGTIQINLNNYKDYMSTA